MSSSIVRSAPTTPQHGTSNVAVPTPRSAGESGATVAPTRPRFLASPPPPLPPSLLDTDNHSSSPLAVAIASTDERSILAALPQRSIAAHSEGSLPPSVIPSVRPTVPVRPLSRSIVSVRARSPRKQPSNANAAPSNPSSAHFAPATLNPAPGKSSHVHLTISDDRSDTDVSVSVSLSRKGQHQTVLQHVHPAGAAHPAPASTTSRSILSSSVFGHGRWSACSHLIVAGVAVTLLLALITIPLLMLSMEVGAGGTDMQRHHMEDEEHGIQHVLRWVMPTAAQSTIASAISSDVLLPLHASSEVSAQSALASITAPADVSDPPQPRAAIPHSEAPPAAQPTFIQPPPPIDLRPVDTSLTMGSYLLPPFDPDTLPATIHNLTLFTTFSPTYQHIPSTFPLRTWTLLFPSSPHQLLVYTPDEVTCDYLTVTHAVPVKCVSLPFCFDDRSKRRRRKPNKGSLWWEYDEDSQREGKIVCLLKDVDRRANTPFVGYFDHEMLLTEDITHALHAVINNRVMTRLVPTAPLTDDDMAVVRKEPFMLIGRTWEVDISSRPRMSWKRQGDDAATQKKKKAAKQPFEAEESDGDYQARLVLIRERLHDWLSDVRAASILVQYEYVSTFPWVKDVEFYALHNTHPLHWFIYPRSVLPMHAISKSSYMHDGSGEQGPEEAEEAEEELLSRNGLDLHHGWESFVVWSAKAKVHPPLQLIDVSDVVHVMHAHAVSAHNHSEHAPPPSLLVFPEKANASEIARIIAAGNPLGINPVAVPLSPGNAHQRLLCDSALPSETCELVAHDDAELDALIESRANGDRQIILLIVNAEYLPLAYNWLCRAREQLISSYLFIAEDRIAYFSLLSRNIPVTLVHYARHRKHTAFTYTNSSWLFDETNYYRAKVLQRAHQHHNLSVLLLHLDLVLFDNPLPLLLPNPHTCDVLVPMNGSFPSGGLFYFPVTALGRRLIRDLVACEEENVQFAHVYGGNRFVFSDDKDATCLYQLVTRLTTRYKFRRCTFDPLLFASEVDFFGRARPQRVGVWPMAVHVEQQKSIERKERVIKEWRMWRWLGQEVDADGWVGGNGTVGRDMEDERLLHPMAMQWRQQRAERWAERGGEHQVAYVACHPTPDELDAELMPEPGHEPGPNVVHLHLLARGDDLQLSATIASLKLVLAAPTLIVHLHVDISALSATSDARSSAANVSHLLLDLEGMQWKHGHKYVRSFKQLASMNAEWIRSWLEVKQAANSNTTHLNASVLCLTMQAGQLISPHAFVLLASLLSSHSMHMDTHLLSIALLHHPHILGETPPRRYGSQVVASIVSARVPAFLYQLSSLSGSVFFLSTILRVLHFYDEHISALTQLSNSGQAANATLWPSTFPCVPSMVSNRWYLSQPEAHFDQYLHRFSFDHGLYTLHFNLLGSRTGRLAHRNQLCTTDLPSNSTADDCNTPLVLLMDDPSLAAVSTRVALLTDTVMSSMFTSLSRMPLYDFQFNSVEEGLNVFARRTSMFAPHNAFDRTLGTAADDPAAEEEVREHLVSDEVEDEEEEEEQLPLVPNVLGAAGTAEEAVKEKVRRHVNATEAQNINAVIRTLVVSEQRTRKQPVPAANNPLALIYPGSLQDRCFLLGSASDVWEDEEDVEMRVRPFIPPATHPAYDGLIAYHRHLVEVHTALLSSPTTVQDTRVLVYQPRVVAAVQLDRQLRGLYFAFILSLCLERMLLIDMPALQAIYDSPTTQSWLYSAYRTKLRALPRQPINASHANILRSAKLEDHFTAPVVYYNDRLTHDRQLLSNPRYRWLPLVLFNTQSRVERTGQVMRYLLSRPSAVLVREAAALMDVLHLRPHGNTKAVMAVRLDFADDAPLATSEQPLPNVTSHFLQCVHNMLSTLAPHPNATRLLFATNRPTKLTYDAISRLLSPFGSVVTYADTFKRIKGRMGRLLSGGAEDDANAVTLSAEMLVGYVLGEVEVVVMTDTTFGVFNTARTGYNSTRQYTVLVTDDTKAGGDGDGYCGPIRRLDRPKRMDIVY